MHDSFKDHLSQQLAELQKNGLYKSERAITTSQGAHVKMNGGKPVLNMCANNYLGLAANPEIIKAARESLDRWGYGLASVRFICGTQSLHRDLEQKLSAFLGTEETILYS